jgi:nucleoside-diphosphate-sugar epimerase
LTGGAGFIAGQTLRQLLPLSPRKVVVADTSEHALAELVRDLRSAGAVPDGVALEPRLVDVTGPLLDRLVAEEGPFDGVLAFAAAKHVRTERDAVSALQMLHVNVNGTLRCVDRVVQTNPDALVFIVSTDKAADPASLMGASKRIMEMAVLGSHPSATSTRFANVAFSSGSLLESWLMRLERDQVLPVPVDTRRYFVSPAESGQLCALASVAPQGSIVVPDPSLVGSVELEDALLAVLHHLGIQPRYVDAGEAIAGAAGIVPDAAGWPVLRTARDTAGEKGAEVFVGAAERERPWLPGLAVVDSAFDTASALELAAWVARAVDQGRAGPALTEITARIARTLPNLHHIAGDARLDDRV